MAITMGEAEAWKRVAGVSLSILIVVHLLRTLPVIFGTGIIVGVFTRPHCTLS
jgi:hypothetical protein